MKREEICNYTLATLPSALRKENLVITKILVGFQFIRAMAPMQHHKQYHIIQKIIVFAHKGWYCIAFIPQLLLYSRSRTK